MTVPTANVMTTTVSTAEAKLTGVLSAVAGQGHRRRIKTVAERVPTLVDVRACFVYSYGTQCTAASSVVKVPHAFGNGYPTADAGPGQVALWTGELNLSDTDAELSAPG